MPNIQSTFMIELAAALWNQRHRILEAKDRLVQLRAAVNWQGDLDLATWVQLYAFCLEFNPDLIIELGRGYGNSTCIFTETANQLGNTQVISIGYDSEKAWNTQTAPRLAGIVSPEWFKPLRILEQDILETNFSEIVSAGTRILLFWDAHGKELADYVLGDLIRLLRKKDHIVLVHDIEDARYCDVDPAYIRADGLPQIWLGDLVSPFDELFPLYDFLSRNRIAFASPLQSLNRELLQNEQKCTELQRCWGLDFPTPTPLEAGGWIYFDLRERHGFGLTRELIFPKFPREKLPPDSTSTVSNSSSTKQTLKLIVPSFLWNLLRHLKKGGLKAS
jgi:hypothetical protein